MICLINILILKESYHGNLTRFSQESWYRYAAKIFLDCVLRFYRVGMERNGEIGLIYPKITFYLRKKM